MACRCGHPHGCPYDHPVREVADTQTEAIYPYGPGVIPRGYEYPTGRRWLGQASHVPPFPAHPFHIVQRSRVVREYLSPYASPPVHEELEQEGLLASLSYRPAPRSHAPSRNANFESSVQRQNHNPAYDGDDAQIVRYRDPSFVPTSPYTSRTRDELRYDGQAQGTNLERSFGSSSRNGAFEPRAPMQHPYLAYENAQDIRYQSPSPVPRLRSGYLSGEDLRRSRRLHGADANRSYDTASPDGPADWLAPAHSKSLVEYSPRNIRYRHVGPFPPQRDGHLLREDLKGDGRWQGQAESVQSRRQSLREYVEDGRGRGREDHERYRYEEDGDYAARGLRAHRPTNSSAPADRYELQIGANKNVRFREDMDSEGRIPERAVETERRLKAPYPFT
ncbi:hypothetical protein EPUS_06845 [Endocarpon pusillum Z07020]|uniref:Uncharacterized protein n=1 Tax=Endocarpon pusillum (strain Z07020 / HMAS-L-300199) TaxID=1263415 RepID=U1GH65_ENDPU|nr:uncharacterized protein EPUS_06845 [Endocarpon pusillum Z07020]ERF71463.1 hypothetical protein EPUS_06845 [Endocarpon pusillum Z07020]